MNHSRQNQQQQNQQNQQSQQHQQNQQQYSEQFLQSLLQSYLMQQQTQQHVMQQSAHQATKTLSSPNIPGMPTPVTPALGTSYPNTIHLQQGEQSVVSAPPTSPVTPVPVSLDNQLLDVEEVSVPKRKRSFTKVLAIALVIGLAVAIYFIWQGAPTSLSTSTPGVQNSTISNASGAGGSVGNVANTGSSSGDIQVYVLGAIKTPGVYTLPSTARVVDLIKAAGGPLPKANLVALNMAAKLTDGEEVYVTMLGETPPTYMGGVPSLNGGNSTPVATGGGGTGTSSTTGTATGQLININTASESDMMTNLHVSSRTAQAIINYRTQNGNYTSVDQLLQVVSRSIYDKIRSQCTV